MNGRKAIVFGYILCVALAGFAQNAPVSSPQTPSGKTTVLNNLRTGISLFSQEKYNEALSIFDVIFLDSSAGELRAEGAYWAAMTHLAKGDTVSATKMMETFLLMFPSHARIPEILYQQARAAYLQQKYDQALQIFQVYIGTYPKGEFYPSAIFWSAESLYAVGRLQDAEKLYKTIDQDFGDSTKAEAARYRLSLIRFKYREEELLTLLKWSHEESLKVLEEFQRREKAYEQALSVYQKRYGDTQRGVTSTQIAMEEEINTLKKSLDELAKKISDRDAQIQRLTASLSSAPPPATAVSAPRATAMPSDKELLALKENALNLMMFYLEKIMAGTETGGDGK